MTKVTDLRNKSTKIPLSPRQVIEEVSKRLSGPLLDIEVFVVMYRKEREPPYELWQGSVGQSFSDERLLWHLEQIKLSLLERRLNGQTG